MWFPMLPGNPRGVVLLHAHVRADIPQGARIHFACESLAVYATRMLCQIFVWHQNVSNICAKHSIPLAMDCNQLKERCALWHTYGPFNCGSGLRTRSLRGLSVAEPRLLSYAPPPRRQSSARLNRTYARTQAAGFLPARWTRANF